MILFWEQKYYQNRFRNKHMGYQIHLEASDIYLKKEISLKLDKIPRKEKLIPGALHHLTVVPGV